MAYRIHTVSRLLGVPRNTLLAWERRYGVVEPARAENGYREYSESDLERLRSVKRLMDEGHKVSEAIRLVDEESNRRILTHHVKDGMLSLVELRKQVAMALLRFDREGASELLQKVPMMGYEQWLDDVWLPVLRDIGTGWQANRVSIAQEHFASTFIRERMMAMLVSLGSGPAGGRRVICAAAAGEHHVGGLLALAVRLALRGLHVTWLGADMPAVDLAEAATTLRAEFVCVTAVTPASDESLVKYLSALRSRTPASCSIVAGGVSPRPSGIDAIDGVRWFESSSSFLAYLGS